MKKVSSSEQTKTKKNTYFVQEYTTLRPKYEAFVNKLQILFEDLLRTKGISYHAIEVRAKTTESFSKKISKRGSIYANPLKDVTDLAGARIILFYQEDVEKVCSIIRNQFEVDPKLSADKRDDLAFDQFGYISVHLITRLSTSRSKLPEWTTFKNMVAEVQVRTVLQHSWASISHALQYRREGDIPLKYRRKLVRLSGLLELADEEFSELRREQEALEKSVDIQISNSQLDINIDALSIRRYLRTSIHVNEITAEALAHPDFEKLTTKSADMDYQLSIVCKVLGISTIAELDQLLYNYKHRAHELFVTLSTINEDKEPSLGDPDHWCTIFLVALHPKVFTMKKLKEINLWYRDYERWIVKAAKAL